MVRPAMRRRPSLLLSRFTTIPVLIDMLESRRIVLLDPDRWEDRNDSRILAHYREQKRIPSLLAVCFSCGDETIHHWNTYAPGISGCCIEFKAGRILERAQTIAGLRHGRVAYRKITNISDGSVDLDDIPFIKRWPYRIEEEYRIIYAGDRTQVAIDLDIDDIRRITLSGRIPAPVFNSVKQHLQGMIRGDRRINRSTICENTVWINKFKALNARPRTPGTDP